jgi:hypothetical protein
MSSFTVRKKFVDRFRMFVPHFQDLSAVFCFDLSKPHSPLTTTTPPSYCYEELMSGSQQPQTTGLICFACKKAITNSTYSLKAINHTWHKECFTCKRCHQRLFSFSKFWEDNDWPVCVQCHSKEIPRCHVCKNPIEGEFTKAGPNNYTLHKECFKCAKCGKPFDANAGFTEDDDGKLLHLECYTADM